MAAKAGKRPLRSLTAHEKLDAIRRVHDGESKASVARDIGVPESTLRGWCKNEEKISYISRQSSPETDDSVNAASSCAFDAPKEKKPRLEEAYNLSLKPSATSSSSSSQLAYSPDYNPTHDDSVVKPLNLNTKEKPLVDAQRNRAELARISVELGLNRPEMYMHSALNDLTSNINLLAQWNTLFMQHQQLKSQVKNESTPTTSACLTTQIPYRTPPEKTDTTKPKLPKIDSQKSAEDSVRYWLNTNQALLTGLASQTSNSQSHLSTASLPASNPADNPWYLQWYAQYLRTPTHLRPLLSPPAPLTTTQSNLSPKSASTPSPQPTSSNTPPPKSVSPQILYQQLTKEYNENTTASSKAKKPRSVLDTLLLHNNNNNVAGNGNKQEENMSQSEALEHGEKFLGWLEACSEPAVTTMQIIQIRTLINNIRTGPERKNGDVHKSSRLFAPMTVFSKKKAHAFEMMNVLCSLLLGRNYNAFNVYGFATKDVTEKIMVRTECPFLEEEHVQEVDQEEEEVPKYTLKPPRDLRSKFVMMMEEKELEKKRKAEEKEAEEERQRQLELEKPPYDELYGMRIHGWILMMPHEKDPPDTKPFFIEPSTGMRHELDSPLYCSIQSVWNNVNYYVNLQDDSTSLGNLDYNLKDLTKWEHLLPGEPIEGRRHARNIEIEEDEEALENLHIMDEKHLDMPEPWSLRISIPYSEVATRFPQGKKFTEYKKIKVEQYSPYVQEDGLVLRMFKYNDLDYTELLSIEERYENRSDKLLKILTDVNTGLVTEYFDRGREDNVKIHTYYKEDNEVESWRNLEFNYQSRFDCLQKLECDALYMTEHYIDREDYFYYRHTQYAPRGEPPPGFIEGPRRIILNVVEKFNRNEEVYASDDIATREFDYIGRQMHLKFHYDKGKITQSTRTFLKPPLSEMVEGVAFRPELTYGYQAEIGAKPVKKSKLYSLLQQQMKAEEDCNLKIRYVEDQIAEFLRVRAAETISPTLDVGLFNREQNYHHRLDMLEKERLERTKKEREIEEELDYLKPYLARYKCKEPLNVMAAILVRDKCLEEYKELLVKRANDLQQAFQKHMTWIKSKYEWYKNEVENLVFEEEQEFFKEMGKARFELHCMDIRLHRQKEVWPDKYKALVQWLELHPQLQILKKKVSVDSSN